jgi:polyisoprenoid-binding protein YceI
MKRVTFILLTIFATTAFTLAQSDWKLDKVHSSIMFTVQHMVISEASRISLSR